MLEVSMWRFQGITESIAPMCSTLPANRARIYHIPAGSEPGPEVRRKETRLLIVRDEFLGSIARFRRTATRYLHAISQAPAKGDISILTARVGCE
jgi:hypothetical protein